MLPCQPSRRGRAPSGALAEVRHPPVLEGAGLNASARGLLCALASVASQRGNGATDGLGEAPQKRPGNPRNTWNEHPAPLEAECHGAPRCPDPVPGLETLGSASRITSGAPLATPAGVSDRQGSKEPKTEVHAPKIRGPRIRGPRGRGPRIREPRIRGPRSRGPRIRGPKIRGPEKGMGFWLTARFDGPGPASRPTYPQSSPQDRFGPVAVLPLRFSIVGVQRREPTDDLRQLADGRRFSCRAAAWRSRRALPRAPSRSRSAGSTRPYRSRHRGSSFHAKGALVVLLGPVAFASDRNASATMLACMSRRHG
jgi:hypothetical protein